MVIDIAPNALEAPTCHGFFASIDQCHPPGFGFQLVNFHAVVRKVERDIRHVQEVVREVFLDQVALVAAANNEVVYSVMGINFHDVPQDGFATNFDHGLGFEVSFL